MRFTPAALVAALLLAVHAGPALAAPNDLEAIDNQAAAARPSLSADGRRVAFLSADATMAYVRDPQARLSLIVSREDRALLTPLGTPVLSDSGRFSCVLVSDPGGADPRVVVRDLEADGLVAATPATGVRDALGASLADADPDPGARDCDVSDDGRRIAFVTRAPLDAADTGGGADVYVLDRTVAPARTVLVSRATGATGVPGDRPSVAPAMTPDGRRVAFRSFAGNLAAGDDPARGDVFVRDLDTATTTWVSRADGPDGAAAVPATGEPLITPAAPPGVGATGASLSADGRLVTFASAVPLLRGVPAGSKVYVRDTVAGTTELASTTPSIRASPSGMFFATPAEATDPQLSADGRWVSFAGTASSFDPGQPGVGRLATVLHDRLTGRNAVISRQSGIFGAPLADPATSASLSTGGAVAAFAAGGRVLRRELDPSRPLPADLPGAPKLTLPAALPGLAAPGGRPAAGGLGGAVALSLSEYAQLHTSLRTGRRGRTVRTGCVAESAATIRAPACVLYGPPEGRATLDGLEGTTSTTTAALLGGPAPGSGRYELRITATDLGGTSTTVPREVVLGAPAPLDRYGHLDLRRTILSGARRGLRLRIPMSCSRLEVPCRTAVSVRLGSRTITRGTVRLAPGSSRTVELPVGRRNSLRIRGRGRAVKATVVLSTAGRGTERIPVRVKRASIFKLLPVRG